MFIKKMYSGQKSMNFGKIMTAWKNYIQLVKTRD